MDGTRVLRDARQRILWDLARNGHARGFERLYRELSGPVLRYLTARLAAREDAEDVASEVFRRFVVRLEHYDPSRGSLQAWVLCMARSALIDHLRRRRPAEPIEAIAETLADGSADSLTQLVEDEEARFVSGVLRTHPAEVREMFSLHFAHGLSYREIAITLELSEAAVKQRFARTLRELRTRLGQRTRMRRSPRRVTEEPRTT